MQRLYSTFPSGWPAVALLLLRGAVGVTAMAEGVFLAFRDEPTLTTSAFGAVALASGLALLLGFLTPVAAGIVALASAGRAFAWMPVPAPNLLADPFAILLMVVVAAAVVLLGPGSFSLDARLFGRREIIIPRKTGAGQG